MARPFCPRLLENAELPFTGANYEFYAATVAKLVMKERLQNAGVRTPEFLAMKKVTPEEIKEVIEKVGFPMLTKVAWGYDSIGIVNNSVIWNYKEAHEKIPDMFRRFSEIYMERFIIGREFTVFIVDVVDGTGLGENGVTRKNGRAYKVFPAMERIFPEDVPEELRFVREDHEYVGADEFVASSKKEAIYSIRNVSEQLNYALTALALDAYLACGGRSYGRVDIREDSRTTTITPTTSTTSTTTHERNYSQGNSEQHSEGSGEDAHRNGNFYVLEVNSQPCISLDCGTPFAEAIKLQPNFLYLLDTIIQHAIASAH